MSHNIAPMVPTTFVVLWFGFFVLGFGGAALVNYLIENWL